MLLKIRTKFAKSLFSRRRPICFPHYVMCTKPHTKKLQPRREEKQKLCTAETRCEDDLQLTNVVFFRGK